MIRWTDTHTHLNDEVYEGELEQILARMEQAGVGRAIVVGYDLASAQKAVELARLHAPLYAAGGSPPRGQGLYGGD